MSNLSNPLFENEKELLERQREEYRNALKNNVTEIKDKSEKVGKQLLIAGGVLAAGYLISNLFGGKKKKKHTSKYDILDSEYYKPKQPRHHQVREYDSMVHAREDEFTLESERQHPEPSGVNALAKTFMNSELVSMITHQLAALLMVYITKRIEDYLQIQKINDIAEANNLETTDVDFTYHEEDAP